MKTRNSLVSTFATAAFLAGATLTTHAQTWDTVSAIPNAVCGDVGADASGNVFAVGRQIALDGSSVAIVQGASGTPGTSWDPLDEYSEPGFNYSYHRAVAAHPGVPGHLFAGGNLNNLQDDGTYQYDTWWFIRERDPATGTWSTAEDATDLANVDNVGQSSCADILVTPTGDVYATGGGQLGTGLGWLVRKRPVGDSAFTTADVDYTGKSAGSGLDMAFHPNLGVIVVGYTNNVWTVRHSTTGTLGSWQTLDAFQTRNRRGWEWTSSTANGVAVSQSTNIFVAGSAWNAGTGKYHWVVRHSTDRGATWAISDNVVPIGGRAEAFGIAHDAHDAQGRIYVCGRSDKGDGYHWIVRRGQQVQKTTTVKGKTVITLVWEWTQIDDYQLESGMNSRANAITVDATGNIFVGGSRLGADGFQHFVVRRLAALPAQ